MAEVRKVKFNPADPTMGYKLWSNGQLQPIGAAPVIVQDPPFPDGWNVTNPVWDFQIINWATPSGYTLTDDGEIRGFGGVVDPGAVGHLPIYDWRIHRWFFMNPNGDGSGYIFNFVGPYYRWGPTAPALPNQTYPSVHTMVDYGQDYVRDVQLDWTTKKWVMLAKSGELAASFAVTSGVPPNPQYWDAYRSLIVRDWGTSTPKILIGHMSGWLYDANFWGSWSGQPLDWYGRDMLADLHLINDGSGVTPMEIAMAAKSGGVYRWFVSDPPTSQFIAPANASTVTTTTRPTIQVGWTDPDGDAIVNIDVRIFGPNVSSITNPTPTIGAAPVPRQAWSTDTRQNGFIPDFDLENGTWQGFVRVKDAATDVSGWTKSTWTQNVSKPAAPTLVVQTVANHIVELNVAGTTNALRFIYVEYTDNGTDWFPVRGANPGPSILTAGVDIFDYEAPFNTERTYRARVASLTPPLSSLWSATAVGEIFGETWTLLKVSDGTETTLSVVPGPSMPTPTGTGVFVPLNGPESIVLTSGWRHGDIKLKLQALTRAARLELTDLIRSGETFLLRNPFGESWFVRFTGEVSPEILRAVALLDENTPTRDARIFDVTLTPVRRPAP
jgi:hypothetical protein